MFDAVPLTAPGPTEDERSGLLGLLSSTIMLRDEALAVAQRVFARGNYCDRSGACTLCRMQSMIAASHQIAVDTAEMLGLDRSSIE